MGEHDFAQIGLAAARETVNVDAPAEAKETLQCGRANYQQRVGQRRSVAILGPQRRVDAALDQPRQGDAGEIGGDEGNNAEQEQPAVAVNEKLDPVVVAKNLSVLWFAVGGNKLVISSAGNNRIGRATTGGCPYKSEFFFAFFALFSVKFPIPIHIYCCFVALGFNLA